MPNIPSPDQKGRSSASDEDDDDAPLTQEEIEAVLGQFPAFSEMTGQDCCIMAGFLLDMNIPVPVDIIAKAHANGLYIAH